MDESVLVYYSVIRWVWAKKGSKHVVMTTGSHRRTCLFGALGMDGRQLFRQYSKINGEFFLSFLRKIKRKWKRFYLFIDGPSWHKSNKVRHFFEENQDSVVPVWFPTCSPEEGSL